MDSDKTAHAGWPVEWYDGTCRECSRLHGFLKEVKQEYGDYFCKPVPPFGDPKAELLVVGLAPGKHGANATGRPFTGDYAGVLLYQTLHKFGFSSGAVSEHAADNLQLHNCRITNAVKCLPPQNKPVGEEERNCNHFLSAEIGQPDLKIILALGLLAHRAILRSLGIRLNRYQFGHNSLHHLDNGVRLIDSYHCSRYNTQTRRLTEPMFHEVFHSVRSQLADIKHDLE
jgi:uracil-DNA glycosylase family 4